ncbi:hypothetical protein DFH06DRAFT_1256624 [Mycena polygramma]|nr:hypothetical protein DFH06DRAFT_1256814 [Mycena polygramma]KAJ7603471.1 hypothetical protein DFH06DRAFT_1256624 [Mycena polygramma]
MSAFPTGTRITYWNAAGQVVYGTVQRASKIPDGTLVVEVREDSGKLITLPATSVTKV